MEFKKRAKNLITDIPTVFIAMRSKETPIIAKIFAAITVSYALSPIDIIPDFIPVLGYLDDLIILPALIIITRKMIPDNIWDKCKDEAQEIWADGKPKKWYYALPIILLWIVIIWIIVRQFYSL